MFKTVFSRKSRPHGRSRDRSNRNGQIAPDNLPDRTRTSPSPTPSYISPPTTSTSVATGSAIAEPSLWALAYGCLRKDNVNLIRDFNECLGISNTNNKAENLVCADIDGVTRKALEEIRKAVDAKDKRSGVTLAIHEYSKKAIEIIIASQSFIATAASAEPHAALVWSGVSLLLPLLLNPSQESEAATKGLADVLHLMAIYEWQEKTYLHHDDIASHFKDSIVRLYTMIWGYQATLLVHLHKNAPSRWANAIFNSGDWSSRVKDIHEQDAKCGTLARVIANNLEEVGRQQEQERWDLLFKNHRDQEEQGHIKILYSNYQAGKNVNPERISGTCEWFLGHASFLAWRKKRSSSLLWLFADPGCGKSVIAKHLVDRGGEALTVNPDLPTVCYFFFKDGDPERTNGAKAMCAILHQLLMQQPLLYKHAILDFKYKNEKFLTDFDALWSVFRRAAMDPLNGEIICVLDALDECHEQSRKALIEKLVDFYRSRDSIGKGRPTMKFFVTSRPEIEVVRDFTDLANAISEVRLRGEDELAQIGGEIDLVIHHKVEQLGRRNNLDEPKRAKLEQNLTSIPHRTYLWLHLTFEDIFKRMTLTDGDISRTTKAIPKTVDEAYTAILDKSPDKEMARKLLQIVLASIRSLTPQEVNVAMLIEPHHERYGDLEMWPAEDSVSVIKNICGLFLSVVDSKVYLIHQTAREFLLHEKSIIPSPSLQHLSLKTWKNSFHPAQSNLLLAQICIWYLRLGEFNESKLVMPGDPFGYEVTEARLQAEELSHYEKTYAFLTYAASHWAQHFNQAQGLPAAALTDTVAFETCDTQSQSFYTWINIFLERRNVSDEYPYDATHLIMASFLGCVPVVKRLLDEKGVQVNPKDDSSRTPLTWAAYMGHEAIFKLLLEREDVQINSKDYESLTPLAWAARKGHEAIVELLLEREEVQINPKDNESQTPLTGAAFKGHKAVVKLLLEREDVQINSKDDSSRTPLTWAARNGHEAVIKLLLERKDVQINPKDNESLTPLAWAARYGHEAVVKLLLEREDVEVNSNDGRGKTPLSIATEFGEKAIVHLLLDRKDVQVDSKDFDSGSWTPLFVASFFGREAIVKLLLKHGAYVHAQDKWDRTPLYLASEMNRPVVVNLLLEHGARTEMVDNKGMTPLSIAKQRGHQEVVNILEEHLALTREVP